MGKGSVDAHMMFEEAQVEGTDCSNRSAMPTCSQQPSRLPTMTSTIAPYSRPPRTSLVTIELMAASASSRMRSTISSSALASARTASTAKRRRIEWYNAARAGVSGGKSVYVVKARNWRRNKDQVRLRCDWQEIGSKRVTYDGRRPSQDLEVDAGRPRTGARRELDVERVADCLQDRVRKQRQVAPALFAERLEDLERHHQAPEAGTFSKGRTGRQSSEAAPIMAQATHAFDRPFEPALRASVSALEATSDAMWLSLDGLLLR
jgi:hypothetical protein